VATAVQLLRHLRTTGALPPAKIAARHDKAAEVEAGYAQYLREERGLAGATPSRGGRRPISSINQEPANRPLSSSPEGSLPRGPRQIRTRRFPPSGSSVEVARGYDPQIWTVIRGRGRGYRTSNAVNRAEVRRVRLLRRRSHLSHACFVSTTRSCRLRKLPLTPK
jgi:hypothetical protein